MTHWSEAVSLRARQLFAKLAYRMTNLSKLCVGLSVAWVIGCGSASIPPQHGAVGQGGGGLAGNGGPAGGGGGSATTGLAGSGGGVAGGTGEAGATGATPGSGGAGGRGSGGVATGAAGVAMGGGGVANGGGGVAMGGGGVATGAGGVATGAGGGAGGAAAGRGGAAGAGGTAAGAAGSPGAAGGATACSNTDSDAMNCGTCGHACLGGDCAGGICQPFLLGTIPDPNELPRVTMLSDGNVYVFSQNGIGAPQTAWQFQSNAPSTPVEFTTGNGTVFCVMNGRLFWVAVQTSTTIDACSLSNCPGTTAPIVTLASTDSLAIYPACDPADDEIVWITTPGSSPTRTIHRASATGANARVVSDFVFPDDGTNWTFVGSAQVTNQIDRLFFADNSADGKGSSTLFYIATKTVDATAVSVATIAGQIDSGTFQGVLTNGTTVVFNAFSPSSTSETFSAPLPNGVLSGPPPPFVTGSIAGGVLDQTTFYGTLSSSAVPSDAIVKCPLGNCSSPTVIARGQASANSFAADATAIYWTTSGQTGALWKAAK